MRHTHCCILARYNISYSSHDTCEGIVEGGSAVVWRARACVCVCVCLMGEISDEKFFVLLLLCGAYLKNQPRNTDSWVLLLGYDSIGVSEL